MTPSSKARELCPLHAPQYIGLPCETCAKIAAALREAQAEAERTRDAQWYDAMKWAGIGGLMRVKVQNKMMNRAAEVEARALRQQTEQER